LDRDRETAVSLRDRIGRALGASQGSLRPDGLGELAVSDAAYDDWDIVRDFGDLATARAFHQALTDQGYEAVLTSDWPLDQWGHGDISLRVEAGMGIEAEESLDPE
jgi:hypothetical protein